MSSNFNFPKILALIILAISLFHTESIYAQSIDIDKLKQLKFRHIGPVGNRIISAVGIAGDPMTYYVGAATGGIWKTIDGGHNWKPIFDDKPVHAIGALALAPSDPEIVYAGTGESFIRSNVSIGNGVWKSMDGGETWEHKGLDSTGRIGRIIVHPTNPNVVYVAAVGHGFTPQKDRGVFKSSDGGNSWEHVLFVDKNTGASDIVMDPNNSRILFAGMWQLELKTWKRVSGGPGSGIHMSKDAGKTWKKLEGNGLPKKPVGKIALAMSPAMPDRVYAQIETGDGVPLNGEETEDGELWRSDDNGKNWILVNKNRDLGGRQAYYTRCEVNPENGNEIYFLAANYSSSIDGGKTVESSPFMSQPNWDHHHMWIDPTDGNRMIVVGDGGLSISQNRGKTWLRQNLGIAQLYHVTTDKNIPYNVLTNRQDGPSMKGPSNSRVGSIFGAGFIPTGLWHDISGGESGFATADPTDPDIIWSSASGYGPVGGIVSRYSEKNGQFRQVEVWPEFTGGHPAESLKYRFQWTFPLLISPHDHNTIYVTSQHVHRTTNGGQSWELISPDLSLNDNSMQKFSGGLTGDNIAVEYANVIYAFDESPVKQGVFWAGTNDGLIHVSQDGGQLWTNVTANLPGLPKLGVVRNIEASKWDPAMAYLTVEFHGVGNFAPYVYKTSDYGKTWKKITNGVDSSILSYCRFIKEDPVRKGLLYLGTENKLYFSMDDGENWQSLMTNLPHTPMYWMDIPEHYNDLVIGTYGRGVWILDDISSLQQMTNDIVKAKAHLFIPKPCYRFHPISANMQFFPEPSFGTDPAYGATIDYWLKSKNDSIKIYILSGNGDTLRTLKSKGAEGLNRVMWDLRGENTKDITMYTRPDHADWFPLDQEGSRKPPLPSFSILTPPGVYEVVLNTGDTTLSQKVEVLKDPHSEGSFLDIASQTDLMKKIYADFNSLGTNISDMELVLKQLNELKLILNKTNNTEFISKIDSSYKVIRNLEGKMIQVKYTGTGQDGVRFPAMLADRFAYLQGVVAISDFPPADQHIEVYEILHQRMLDYDGEWKQIKSGLLNDLRSSLNQKGIGLLLSN